MIQDFPLEILVDPLQNWFTENARSLPWRTDPTPYHVWISEIMLQQTRVEAVRNYYSRFINELPDVRSLAECSEDEYLKLWEGLGYYSRVRNLHAAAQQIMEKYSGEIPSDYGTLLTLKGIGHYTAGAISSIAFGYPAAAVDGNVLRVLTRVAGDDTDIMQQPFRNMVEKIITSLLQNQPGANPRIFNQALMELGALVCLPNGAPHCGECPWEKCCRAKQEARIGQLPVKKKAKERRIEKRTVILLLDGGLTALHKRDSKGLLAGLYELPNYPGHLTEEEVLQLVEDQGYHALHIQPLGKAKHIFTHIEWDMIGYQIRLEETSFGTEEKGGNLFFVDTEEARSHYCVPSAFSAYVGYMKEKDDEKQNF